MQYKSVRAIIGNAFKKLEKRLNIMAKNREEHKRHKDLQKFSKEVFAGTLYYNDVTNISAIEPFIATSIEAFSIAFSRNLNEEQRNNVESIIKKWFRIGSNLQHQGIMCWREGLVILSVF